MIDIVALATLFAVGRLLCAPRPAAPSPRFGRGAKAPENAKIAFPVSNKINHLQKKASKIAKSAVLYPPPNQSLTKIDIAECVLKNPPIFNRIIHIEQEKQKNGKNIEIDSPFLRFCRNSMK